MNLDFCSIDDLLTQRRSLRRKLLAQEGLREIRIAVLGGSTTNEVVDFPEVLLLSSGFLPAFHQSEFGRYYEDAVLDPQTLIDFRPDIVYLHTSCINVQIFPPLQCDHNDVQSFVDAELSRYQQIWQALQKNLSCQIIQNNFELPPVAIFGNMDMVFGGA